MPDFVLKGAFSQNPRLGRACCLILLFLLTACKNPELDCADALGCLLIEPGEPVRLGYLLALSGDGAFLGEGSLRGIEMAVSHRGAILLDHPLELVGADSVCHINQGRLQALELTSENPDIVGVIGPNCSEAARVAIPIIQRAGLVMISPSATAPDLAQADTAPNGVWQQSYFRTVPSSLWQARIAADFAYQELGVQTAAIIYDNTAYSRGLQQMFTQTFAAMGGVVLFEGQLSIEKPDITDLIAAIEISPPDLLYLPLYEPEGNFVVNSLSETNRPILLGSDSLFVNSFAQSTGTAVEEMYLSGPAVMGDAYLDFLAEWRERYGTAPIDSFHAHAYDAANVLLTAVESVAQVGSDNTLLIGRQALRETIANTAGFNGLTGELTCVASECASLSAVGIYQLSDAEVNGEQWPPMLVWRP